MEQKGRKKTRWLVFLLLWGAGGFLELPFIQLLVYGDSFLLDRYVGLVWVGHILFSVLFILFYRSWAFLVVGFPPFGWLAAGFFFWATHLSSSLYLEDEELIEKGGKTVVPLMGLGTKQARKERILEELDFMPFVDILKGADLDLKRGAIEKLSQLKTPETIQLLLSYRSDPSLEVRFFVTSALTRIKKEFDEEVKAAKDQMKRDIYKISARAFLAKTYLHFSRSGIMDEMTQKSYRQEAEFHLKFCLESEYVSVESFRFLLEIYQSEERWEESTALVSEMERRKIVSLLEIEKLKVEILFDRGLFYEVRDRLRRLKDQGELEADWVPMADWWRGGAV